MSWWRDTPFGVSRCLHVLFILPGAQRLHCWAKERLNRLGSNLPSSSPTESKLGNSVAGTKRVFVGLLPCLGGCSRTTAFLGWTESAQSAFSPLLLQQKPLPSHRPCLGDNSGHPGASAWPELKAEALKIYSALADVAQWIEHQPAN